MGRCIQLQQRNCSRFARDFLRRSTFSSSQRTGSTITGLRFATQDLFIGASGVVAAVLRRKSPGSTREDTRLYTKCKCEFIEFLS